MDATSLAERVELALEKMRLEISQLRVQVVRKAYSPKEAAETLGVGITTVKKLLRDGKLLSVEIGRRRCIPASELERLLTPSPKKAPAHVPLRGKARRKAALSEAEKIRAALRR